MISLPCVSNSTDELQNFFRSCDAIVILVYKAEQLIDYLEIKHVESL